VRFGRKGKHRRKFARLLVFRMTDSTLEKRLEDIVRSDDQVMALLEFLARSEKASWCLGAGMLAGRIWNHLTDRPGDHGLNDIDVAFYDPDDLSYEREESLAARLDTAFPDFSVPFDVKNQARVHLWYEAKFGRPVAPFASLEEALATWPTTCNALGVSLRRNRLSIIAPYGLEDLFAMRVRPNKRLVTEEVYRTKVARWKDCWPELQIADW
jgi:hypothetical protein